MAQRKEYYSIELWYKSGYARQPIFGSGTDNLDSILKSVEIDTYKPIDLYDFSGEPRRAKISLFISNDDDMLNYFEVLSFGETMRIEDTTDISDLTGINTIDPFLNQFPGSSSGITFPSWYSSVFPYRVQPPVRNEGEEISGSYLDFKDIYILKQSKFFNIYVEIYLHKEFSDTNIISQNCVFVGMIEADTLDVKTKEKMVTFEAVDGLGILYDALESYSEFCNFCQSESVIDGIDIPDKTTGITMQDFMTYVLPELVNYPYQTLFDFYSWGNFVFPSIDLLVSFSTQVLLYQTQVGGVGWSYTHGGLSYIWSDDNYVYVLFTAKITSSSQGEQYFGAGVKYAILESSEGNISLDIPLAADLVIYWNAFGGYSAEYAWFFTYGGQIQSNASALFPTNPNTAGYSALSYSSVNAITFQIRGAIYSVYAEIDGAADTTRTIHFSEGELSAVDTDVYDQCVSFNANMTPLSVLRIACLTTAQFLVADGYSIKFKTIDPLNYSGVRSISFNDIIKGTFNPFMAEKQIPDFEEIENVTLWEDVDGDDGKGLKAKLKNKFRLLRQSEACIKFTYNGKINWGEVIVINNHPRQSTYEGKDFFVYSAEQNKKNTKVEAFWVTGEGSS